MLLTEITSVFNSNLATVRVHIPICAMNSSDDDQDFPDDTDGDFADNCVTLDLFSDATFATPSECLLDAKRRHGVDFGYGIMFPMNTLDMNRFARLAGTAR